jgi:hypothetical protein
LLGARPAGKHAGWSLLLVLEVDVGHSLLLLKDPLLGRGFPQKRHVLEDNVEVVVRCMAVGGNSEEIRGYKGEEVSKG